MIKDAYEGLRKRFRVLPEFEELDHEFEISTLEHEQFLLRGIKKRMAERLEDLASLLGDILHPSSESMALMYEWRFIDAKEKKTVYLLYKRLQCILRSFDEAELLQDEGRDVQLIADTAKVWKELRQACVRYVSHLKEAWTKEEEGKEELGYLG